MNKCLKFSQSLDEVRENSLIQEDSLQNWVVWSDNYISQFSETALGWLCDISLAKSLEDVQIALEEGFWKWSRAVTQDVKCEYWSTKPRLHIGLLYLQWKQDTISFAQCLYYVWCYVHVGYQIDSDGILAPFSDGILEGLVSELQSYNLHNKPIEEIEDREIEENFQKKVATMFIPFAELASQYLKKLPINASIINPYSAVI